MSGRVLKNRRKNVLSLGRQRVTQALAILGLHLVSHKHGFPHRARGKQQGSGPVPTHVRSHSPLTQDKKAGEGRSSQLPATTSRLFQANLQTKKQQCGLEPAADQTPKLKSWGFNWEVLLVRKCLSKDLIRGNIKWTVITDCTWRLNLEQSAGSIPPSHETLVYLNLLFNGFVLFFSHLLIHVFVHSFQRY